MAEAALAPRNIRAYAHGRLRGEIRVFGELASTNTTLRELAASGASEGLVVLADAQTSGGLLIAVPPTRVEQLVQKLTDAGTLAHAVVGEVVSGAAGTIDVRA